jgi:hypothetical protein
VARLKGEQLHQVGAAAVPPALVGNEDVTDVDREPSEQPNVDPLCHGPADDND